jgi:hypothetical protein
LLVLVLIRSQLQPFVIIDLAFHTEPLLISKAAIRVERAWRRSPGSMAIPTNRAGSAKILVDLGGPVRKLGRQSPWRPWPG